jgi:glycosyltransferase involved in cell wall biosynthesis
MSETGAGARRTFDGVVCIGGEDWWYHNRGHFDFQIMRRLARTWPVLFVNSLGVRMPSPTGDRHFLARLARKARSLARGMARVENRFHVVSPLSVPGGIGQRLSDVALAPQIRVAARAAGIRRPLLWVHCPAGAGLVDRLAPVATVLQRTDRFEAFPEGDPARLGAQIRALKAQADLVVYAAPHLMAEEAGEVRRQLLVTHGVDLAAFRAAGAGGEEPADVRGVGRPRVGFIGGIDAHTFDPPLFLEVARRLPDLGFFLVGGSSLPEGWCTLPNVAHLGRKPYEEVARYMAAADVLIMPWNASEWIKACNPIKLKEYLATGRPVVTRDFAALAGWRDLVHVANDAESFAAAIRLALVARFPKAETDRRLEAETWEHKADLIRAGLGALGLFFAPSAAAEAAGSIAPHSVQGTPPA